MNKLIIILMSISLLSACNVSSDSEKAKNEKKTKLLEGQLKTIEKAKDAQKKVKQAAEKQRKAIEQATENKKQKKDQG
jgi:uncharacterized lipoprotein